MIKKIKDKGKFQTDRKWKEIIYASKMNSTKDLFIYFFIYFFFFSFLKLSLNFLIINKSHYLPNKLKNIYGNKMHLSLNMWLFIEKNHYFQL